jgi:ubiquinone/menaquinone biosynthesis C-methylase UbiE
MVNNETYMARPDKVKRVWSDKAQDEIMQQRKFVAWMNHPYIEHYYLNQRLTGNVNENWLIYFKKKYIPQTLQIGLTLGCGEGSLERHAIQIKICKKIEAFDIADGAIVLAQTEAAKRNLQELIKYEVRDINNIALEEAKYDVIFVCMAAHHFQSLEHIFHEISNALKPRGFFVLNEFVGPSQFQWTDQQLIIINDLLALLPVKYRNYVPLPGQSKNHCRRLSLEEMNIIDPSEAIRSAEIIPLLCRHFKIIERFDYGGTILHLLLQDIAGNFDSEKEEDLTLLKLLCYVEEILISHNVLSSDFTFIITQKM